MENKRGGGGGEGKINQCIMCTVCFTPSFYFNLFFLSEHRQRGLLKTTLYMGLCTYIIHLPLRTVSVLFDTIGLKLTRL
jgi:hypothetical protein